MNTTFKLFLLTVLTATILAAGVVTVDPHEGHNHGPSSYWTQPSPPKSENSRDFSTPDWYPKKNLQSNNTSTKKPVRERVQLFSKQSLWKVFDYMNRGIVAKDERCKFNATPLKSGCCMKGSFYEEEVCWSTIIKYSIFTSAALAAFLVITVLLFVTLFCVCVKTCRRNRKLQALMQKKGKVAPSNVPSVPTLTQAIKPPTQYASINNNQVTNQKPKCTCPHKKIEKNIPLNNNINTTCNDFFYQPPKLSSPLIQKPTQRFNQIEMNNTNVDVEVNNPYPKFDFVVRSNINYY